MKKLATAAAVAALLGASVSASAFWGGGPWGGGPGYGGGGNDISVEFETNNGINQSLGASVQGTTITVSLGTDANGNVTSTEADVVAAIDELFDALISELRELLPDLGQHLAVDSKQIETYARGRKEPAESGDPDADWGKKVKRGQRADGTLWEKVTKWFGYKLHLLVDSHYELPLSWKLTKASVSDTTELIPLVEDLKQRRSDRIAGAKDLSADKGYDSEKNNAWLWDECEIKPVIDNRLMWKQEQTRLLDEGKADNVVYDEKGQVYCFCPRTAEQRELVRLISDAELHTLRSQHGHDGFLIETDQLDHRVRTFRGDVESRKVVRLCAGGAA